MFLELLEQRRLLSIMVTSLAGHLQVTDTDGGADVDVAEGDIIGGGLGNDFNNPDVLLAANGHVVVTDEVANVEYSFTGITSCTIDALASDDSVTTETQSFGVHINFKNGSPVFSSAVITDGGTGSSIVTTDDIGQYSVTIIQGNGTTVDGGNSQNLVELLGGTANINLGNGDNTIVIQPGTSTTLQLGTGDNTIYNFGTITSPTVPLPSSAAVGGAALLLIAGGMAVRRARRPATTEGELNGDPETPARGDGPRLD